MDKTSGELHFSRLGKILYGPGSVGQLGSEMAALGARRVIIATGRTLSRSPLLDKVTRALGDCCAGVFSDMVQHGADDVAEALAAEMRRIDADGIVSFGGGSPNDTAKAAVAAVISGRKVADMATLDFFTPTDLSTGSRDIPIIAVPTTLSAGEYNPGGGATDKEGVKGAIYNIRLSPSVIINDAELTAGTNDQLWTSTGIRALDHMVEALYSAYSQSFTDALAVKGIRLLMKHLPHSVEMPGSQQWLEHRGQCLAAATLSNFAAVNTRYGVSHAFGHKVGPMWQIPHGYTSCVTLPHAMRLMARVAPERFEALSEALDVDFEHRNPGSGAMACVEMVETFIDGMGLPHSLEEVGVPGGELDKVAELIRYEIEYLDAAGFGVTLADVDRMLREMYPRR